MHGWWARLPSTSCKVSSLFHGWLADTAFQTPSLPIAIAIAIAICHNPLFASPCLASAPGTLSSNTDASVRLISCSLLRPPPPIHLPNRQRTPSLGGPLLPLGRPSLPCPDGRRVVHSRIASPDSTLGAVSSLNTTSTPPPIPHTLPVPLLPLPTPGHCQNRRRPRASITTDRTQKVLTPSPGGREPRFSDA